jgi:hypothetical protein
MTRHRYPGRALAADYARSALGLGATGGIVAFANALPFWTYLFGGLALMFLAYGVRTAVRQLTVVECSETGLAAGGPRPISIAWKDVRDVRLRYFSTRRDRSAGWLQLTVAGPRASIRLDSQLQDFEAVAARALRAAEANGVEIGRDTAANARALARRG